MNTETPAPARRRPNVWLLVALGVVIAAFFATRTWSNGSAIVPVSSSNQQVRAQKKDANQHIDPKELKVRLEALEAPRPEEGKTDRNPFRFQPRAAPAPPAPAFTPPPVAPMDNGGLPPPPPGPPPIPLKFMGSVEKPNGVKIAALSDCRAATFAASEGQEVDGRYRVVKIGIESLVIEYIDGKGRQTLRKEGCSPR
jgi:hypothetical protein